jgi:hypothetical protein
MARVEERREKGRTERGKRGHRGRREDAARAVGRSTLLAELVSFESLLSYKQSIVVAI